LGFKRLNTWHLSFKMPPEFSDSTSSHGFTPSPNVFETSEDFEVNRLWRMITDAHKKKRRDRSQCTVDGSKQVDKVLDLSHCLLKGTYIGCGACGDVFHGTWQKVPPHIQESTDLPRVVIKICRVGNPEDERSNTLLQVSGSLYVLQHSHLIRLLFNRVLHESSRSGRA
jgi:hypothetical protein